jgi:hypothetical protein
MQFNAFTIILRGLGMGDCVIFQKLDKARMEQSLT